MLGKTIKELRINKGLSQEELAKALGITRPAVTKYERNERMPDLEMILKISNYFNVSTDYLLENHSSKSTEYAAIISVNMMYEIDAYVNMGYELTEEILNSIISITRHSTKVILNLSKKEK